MLCNRPLLTGLAFSMLGAAILTPAAASASDAKMSPAEILRAAGIGTTNTAGTSTVAGQLAGSAAVGILKSAGLGLLHAGVALTPDKVEANNETPVLFSWTYAPTADDAAKQFRDKVEGAFSTTFPGASKADNGESAATYRVSGQFCTDQPNSCLVGLVFSPPAPCAAPAPGTPGDGNCFVNKVHFTFGDPVAQGFDFSLYGGKLTSALPADTYLYMPRGAQIPSHLNVFTYRLNILYHAGSPQRI